MNSQLQPHVAINQVGLNQFNFGLFPNGTNSPAINFDVQIYSNQEQQIAALMRQVQDLQRTNTSLLIANRNLSIVNTNLAEANLLLQATINGQQMTLNAITNTHIQLMNNQQQPATSDNKMNTEHN